MKNESSKSDKTPKQAMTLVKLVEQYHEEGACRSHLAEVRWPNGATCPRCNGLERVSKLPKAEKWNCGACRYQFTATTGTIFADTHLPLWKWFMAIYLMLESRKGMSANQLKRTLDVSYKTAWFLCHRIRNAMADGNAPLLNGIVEVDETYVGGKVRGKGRGYRKNKAIAMGVLQRGGEVRLQTVKVGDRKTLHKFIHDKTADECPAIYTDENPAYLGIADHNTRHETVNHSAEEWVNGDVHTNGIESVWSLLKRSVIGTYHKVSMKHLDAYLGELEHRFNNRKNEFLFRDTLLKLVKADKLTFSELTKAA